VGFYEKEIVNPNDEASKLAHAVNMGSFQNSPAVQVIPMDPGNFRGQVGYLWAPEVAKLLYESSLHPANWTMMQCAENDGAGGKLQFHALSGDPEVFKWASNEIIAMCADDVARSGGLPVVFANEISVRRVTKENFHLFQALMDGFAWNLTENRLVSNTGETAILTDCITGFCDTGRSDMLLAVWGGHCTGLMHRELRIDNGRIKPGMTIIAFKDPGYRCNGGTLMTRILQYRSGGDMRQIHDMTNLMAFNRKLTTPSQSYAKALADMIGWCPDGSIKPLKQRIPFAGIAHITGGGVWGKFGEILPKGVGAVLDQMPEPPKVLLQAQEMSQEFEDIALTDHDCYGTFHGGPGMMLVLDENHVDSVLKHARHNDIVAQVVGHTTESAERELVIHSRFKEGALLSSLDNE